jgi:hypothetical protein
MSSYPYRNRFRWFLFGRYSHLARAARDHPRFAKDGTLAHRIHSLRTWNSVRFFVSLPLTLGLMATVASAVAKYVPGGAAENVVDDVLAYSTTLTGVFTLAFLLISRLLGQLEIDILALLTLET